MLSMHNQAFNLGCSINKMSGNIKNLTTTETSNNNSTTIESEKFIKMEAEDGEEPREPNYDLTKFQLTRILQNNTVRKSIALLGTFPDLSATDEAIVLFEKGAFHESDVQTREKENPALDPQAEQIEDNSKAEQSTEKPSYFSSTLQVQKQFINNIYGSFQCVPTAELNAVKTTVVYPATEKHIEKYSITQRFLISETPTIYENLTLPFITSSQFSLNWVYNILEHKQETERIVFEDSDPETGFVLLPDLKWDGKNVDNLYLLAIIHKHNIKSLRDLSGEHLPLLRNLRTRAAAAIEERYGLNAFQLRMYFHYQPSFYHLHLHINPVRSDAPGIWCDKSHMLETVINNLELLPDYYQRATLPFVLYEGSKMLEKYEEKVSVRKRVKLVAVHDNNDAAQKAKKQKLMNESVVSNEKDAESNDNAAEGNEKVSVSNE